MNYKLADKESNTIESSLRISQVSSEHHLRNFTCKLVQYQLLSEQQPNSVEQQGGEQLWQTSDTIQLNVAFKPIVTLDVFKSNTNMIRLAIAKAQQQRPSALLSLYRDDIDDVWFRCAYRANPMDERSLKIVWKLNDRVVNVHPNGDVDDRSGGSLGHNSELFAWKSSRVRRESLLSSEVNLTCEVENSVGKGTFNARVTQLCKTLTFFIKFQKDLV